MRTLPLASAALLIAASSPAFATTVLLQDDFNSENSSEASLNFNGFANFEVVSGGVDLIGNGDFDFLPGNGLFLDLDGSDGIGGGSLVLDADLLDGVSGAIEVSFDLAGSQRSASRTNAVDVSLNGTTQTFELANDTGFETFTLVTDAAEGLALSFNQGGTDGVGVLLDNVVITSLEDGLDAGSGSVDDGIAGPGFETDSGSDSGASSGAVSVPTPGAAAAGMLLLGGIASRRRRAARA